jgi:hypothetical protein
MGGGGSCTKIGAPMGLGIQEPAETNGGHLQAASPGKIQGSTGLVEECILEFQGDRKTAMSLVGTGSPTSKTLKKRCSGASRHISRSGLIREFNGTRSNCRRAGKTGSAIWAAKRGEGRGGWSREVLTPPSGDDVEFLRCCDIQLPSKDKGNKISQPLLPRKRAPLCAVA